MTEILDLDAAALAQAIAAGALSAHEAVTASLARIAAVQPTLNAFALILEEEALAAAAKADRAQAAGAPLGPLHGVPVAFKDFTPTRGHVTTRGSAAFADWVPDADPAIVRRFKAAGAIIVAKTTTPEFAHSSFTHSPLHGVTRNPWDPARTSGGSSGGSAVAVTTGCIPLAEGTDMGGSVRIPAGACGCVGLKPSLGRIPMDILPTVFDDMSHFGPLTRTVGDAALFLGVAQGQDQGDILSQRGPSALPTAFSGDLRGKRIALCEDLGFYAVEASVAANLREAAAALQEAGAEIEPVALPWTADDATAWGQWWAVYQAAAFGHLLADWRDRMDPALVALMEAAEGVSALDLARIDQRRSRMWAALAPILERCDALLAPTNAIPAPAAEGVDADFERIDAEGRWHGFDMTSPFNMLSPCPALSLPSGMSPGMSSDGLPTGAQIVGRPFDDGTALAVGAALEARRPWPRWTLDRLGAAQA